MLIKSTIRQGGTGFTGSDGYTGSLGYTGSRGYDGSDGAYAAVGYTGSRGYTGSLGYTGSRGYTGSSAAITLGITAITGGSTGRLLYDNAGLLGEYTVTGTGSVAMSDSPTLTGTLTAATIVGSSVTAAGVGAIVRSYDTTAAHVGLYMSSASGVAYLNTTNNAGSYTGTSMSFTTAATGISTALTYGGVTLSNSVTGTGSMVLSQSPVLTTPALGVATATSLALGGASGATLAVTGTANISGDVTAQSHVLLGDGTVGSPAYSFSGATNLGFFRSGNDIIHSSGGTAQHRLGQAFLGLRSIGSLSWSSTTDPAGTLDLILTRRAAASLNLGSADAAAPVAQTLSVQSVVAGTTNVAGANWTFKGSQGTGTGAGGSIIFQTAAAGVSGSAQNALANSFEHGYSSSKIYGTLNLQNRVDGNDGFTLRTADGTNRGVIYVSASYLYVQTSNLPIYLNTGTNGNVWYGTDFAATAQNQIINVQGITAGTVDTAGGSLTIKGSRGTGTGAGGSIIFQTAPAGSAGSAQNALATALTITGAGGLQAATLALGGATIGTNALAVTGTTAFSGDVTLGALRATSGVALGWGASGLLLTTSTGVYGFSANSTTTGTGDTGLSRISAGTIGVGTGAAGSIAGGLQAATLALGGASLGGVRALSVVGSSEFTQRLVITNAGDPMIDFVRSGGNTFSIQHDTTQWYLYNSTTAAAALLVTNARAVSMPVSLAIGGATIGTNTLAVTGTSALPFIVTGSSGPNKNVFSMTSGGSQYGTIQVEATAGTGAWSLGYQAASSSTIGTAALTWNGSGQVSIPTSLALGGATIGSDVLAATGNAKISGNLYVGTAGGQLVFNSGTRIDDSGIATLRLINNSASNIVYLTIAGATATPNLQFGAPSAAAPVAQTLSVQSVVAGTTNVAGANWTFAGSQGTGTGAGGSIIFQTAAAGVSGSAQNALATALTITGAGALQAASSLAIGGATILSNALAVTGTAAFSGNITHTANLFTAGAGSTEYVIQTASTAPLAMVSMGSYLDLYSGSGSATNRMLRLASSGIITLGSTTTPGFLAFGGITNLFPAIKRNATALNFRLADDSADAPITAGASVFSGMVEVRNSTTAQAFRVYNTYTDASNYEMAQFSWGSNVLSIGTSNLGTSSVRQFQFVVGGIAYGGFNGSGRFYTAQGPAFSQLFGASAYVAGADLAVVANSTNYNNVFTVQSYNASIATGITDSGYRQALQVESYIASSAFLGTLATQTAVWARHGAYGTTGVGSVITNSYGVYIESMTNVNTTITNLWGFYQTGATAKNYFAGSLGIGTTSIGSNALAVTGTANISGNVTIGGVVNATGTVNSIDGRFTQLSGPVIDLRTANTVKFFRTDTVTLADVQGGSLALGGAALSGNALAVTGSASFSSGVAAASYTVSSTGFFTNDSSGSFQHRDSSQTNGFTLTATTPYATPTVQFGYADAAAPIAQTLRAQGVVAGTTNVAGANWTFKGSQGTGTGAGGSIIFQTAPAGSAGSAQNALANSFEHAYATSKIYGTLSLQNRVDGNDSLYLRSADGAYRGSIYVSPSYFYVQTSNLPLFLCTGTNGNVWLGEGGAATAQNQTLNVQGISTGTVDTAGGSLTIKGSRGTGTGAGGSIIFQTAAAGVSGSAQNALATALTITSTGALQAASSLAIGGATIGTNALAVTGTVDISSTLSVGTAGGSGMANYGNYNTGATRVVGWGNSSIGTIDTAFSRISAGIIGVGTGAAGSVAGSMQMATLDFGTAGNAGIKWGASSLGLFNNSNNVLAVRNSTNSSDAVVSAGAYSFGTSGKIRAPSDGVFTLLNNAETDFSRINFGGTTNLFPAIKRNGTGIMIAFADDSNYAPLVSGSIVAAGSVTTTSQFNWNAGTRMVGTVDGNLTLMDSASATFGRINFGGTTNLFPAIKRNATALNFRLADDSADAPISASSGNFSSWVQASGTFLFNSAGRITAQSDGVVTLSDSAATSFGRLQFGGTTNLFPAIKRSGAGLQVVLADESNWAAISARNFISVESITSPVYTYTGSSTSIGQAGGTGSPEGVVARGVGSTWCRTDGGAGTTFYVKESGGATSTGWVAK